jgi:hypothetical protein
MSGCWLRLTMVDFCCSNVDALARILAYSRISFLNAIPVWVPTVGQRCSVV